MWNVMMPGLVIIVEHYTHLLLYLLYLHHHIYYPRNNSRSNNNNSIITMGTVYENSCKHEMRCTAEMPTWVQLHYTQTFHNFLHEKMTKTLCHCIKSYHSKKKKIWKVICKVNNLHSLILIRLQTSARVASLQIITTIVIDICIKMQIYYHQHCHLLLYLIHMRVFSHWPVAMTTVDTLSVLAALQVILCYITTCNASIKLWHYTLHSFLSSHCIRWTQ